jgi:hypothetical protein
MIVKLRHLADDQMLVGMIAYQQSGLLGVAAIIAAGLAARAGRRLLAA